MTRFHGLVVTVAVLFSVCVQTGHGQDDINQCDLKTGPAGQNACVKFDQHYNDYQWATCLSNAYIKQMSANRYTCAASTATFCWLQCMLENYDSMGPNVYGNCLCKSSSTITVSSVTASASTLPSSCKFEYAL